MDGSSVQLCSPITYHLVGHSHAPLCRGHVFSRCTLCFLNLLHESAFKLPIYSANTCQILDGYQGSANTKTKCKSLPARCYSLEEKHTGNDKALMGYFVTQGVRGSHRDQRPGTSFTGGERGGEVRKDLQRV